MSEPLLKRLYNMANEPTTSFSARALMRDVADEIDRLRRMEAVVESDDFIRQVLDPMLISRTPAYAIVTYRDALLAAMKGE